MKKLLYITLTLVLIGGTLFTTWCFHQAWSSEVYVLIDITDPHVQTLDGSLIADKAIVDVHQWGAATVHVSTISDLDYNNMQTVDLSAAFIPLCNPQFRQQQLDTFRSDVLNTVNTIYPVDSGKTRSSIYIPLTRALNALAISIAANKTLYVSSDLMENTDSFSMYRPAGIKMINREPEKVLQILEREEPVGDLNGITMYLIYQPKNREDEQKHLLMAHLLQRLFLLHHANVILSTNLITH